MKVTIFDVEHGHCSLIEVDGKYIMVDCGSSPNWSPGEYLRWRGITEIDLLVNQNYDEDHASGLPDLMASVRVKSFLRNKSVTTAQIREMKRQCGMAKGIARLVDAVDNHFTGGSSGVLETPNFSYKVHRNTPSTVGLEPNDLSLVFEAKIGGATFLFCGDLLTTGFDALGSDIVDAVSRANVLIAPHHGRENGRWEGFIEHASPVFTVVSDKAYAHGTQEGENAFYGQFTTGSIFNGKQRKVLTTLNDGSIHFDLANRQYYSAETHYQKKSA